MAGVHVKHGIADAAPLIRAPPAGVLTKRTAVRYALSHDQKLRGQGYAVRGLPSQIQGRVRAKLLELDAAGKLDDLRARPGNRLEVLRGDRQDQHSIRINDQWRVCFVWKNGDAFNVEVTDYH